MWKIEKNKILVVEPNKEPFVKIVQDIEKSIIEIVGEEIEYLEIEEDIDLICSGYIKKKDTPYNKLVKKHHIIGTFVVVAHQGDNWISLNNKQIEKYKKIFKLKGE